MVCFFAPTVVALSAMGSLYRRSLKRSFLDELPMLEAIAALAAMLMLSGLVFRSGVEGSLGSVGSAVARVWICAAVLVPAGRLLWIVARRRGFRRDVLKAPMLIVGNGRIAAKVVERINANPEYGSRLVARRSRLTNGMISLRQRRHSRRSRSSSAQR